ncbi:MAG: FAD-dependent monooxygenase [Desulfobacter sp.]|nr:FAD-dependent monooxygenase [Desulfobacter sp.]WDP84808.1 MAG: FAD-dependent monooxygenase [Desulfobacter sp.]
MADKKYDFIITGAGPTGLAAAITAGRLGASCVVLEKGKKPGPEPRGESIADYDFMDELLGKDWLKNNASNDPSFRRFHSPMDRKNRLIDVHRPYYFFHWDHLMTHMKTLALAAGAQFLFESEVVDLIETDHGCTGIRYQDKQHNLHEIKGRTTLGCMGHKDPLGKKFGIKREQIDCPTMKYYSANAPRVNLSEHPNLQFYLISPKMLEIAPNLPPAVVYVFPLADGKMEAGLMLRLGQLENLKDVEIPDPKLMHKVWDHLTQNYPGFSDFFKGAQTSYKKLTMISNRQLFENIIPHERGGLIFLGDTIGFSEANGSSGLYFGMAQADFWVRLILENTGPEKFLWSKAFAQNARREYQKWPVYTHIKKSYKDIVLAEKIMFKFCGSDRGLNRWWTPLMALLQMKS